MSVHGAFVKETHIVSINSRAYDAVVDLHQQVVKAQAFPDFLLHVFFDAFLLGGERLGINIAIADLREKEE